MSATGQTLVALNVRGGINDPEKRLSISRWISEQRCAVAVLTECHGNANALDHYRRNFPNSVWCLRDADVFGGVGIVCNRSAKIIFEECFIPQQDGLPWSGRALLAKIEINATTITVVGIYAPSQGVERLGFFDAINEWLSTLLTIDDAVFIVGDFNCTINQRIDRFSPRSNHDV